MKSDDRHHVIYEVKGNIDQLSKIDRSDLLDKKVVEKPQDDVTLDLKNKTIYEELEIYLNHIKVADTTNVLEEFKSSWNQLDFSVIELTGSMLIISLAGVLQILIGMLLEYTEHVDCISPRV